MDGRVHACGWVQSKFMSTGCEEWFRQHVPELLETSKVSLQTEQVVSSKVPDLQGLSTSGLRVDR